MLIPAEPILVQAIHKDKWEHSSKSLQVGFHGVNIFGAKMACRKSQSVTGGRVQPLKPFGIIWIALASWNTFHLVDYHQY